MFDTNSRKLFGWRQVAFPEDTFPKTQVVTVRLFSVKKRSESNQNKAKRKKNQIKYASWSKDSTSISLARPVGGKGPGKEDQQQLGAEKRCYLKREIVPDWEVQIQLYFK